MSPIFRPRIVPTRTGLVLPVFVDHRLPIDRHRGIRPPLNHVQTYPAARERRRADFAGIASSSAVVSFS